MTNSDNFICGLILTVSGALVASKICHDINKNKCEHFANETSYKLLFPGLQFTQDGKNFLNKPGKNVYKEEPRETYLVERNEVGDNFYARPTYATSPSYRFNPNGVTSQTRGRATDNDAPTMATYSSLDAMKLATMVEKTDVDSSTSSSMEGGGDHKKYHDPLEYVPTNELLVKPDISAMTFGKDPSDPSTFMYTRNIYANKKRRNWVGADLIRGDLPIAPDNRGWFQVSAKAHLDLRRGALQHISDGDLGIYNNVGPSMSTNISLEDTLVENDRAHGKNKSPAQYTFERLSA